MCHLLVGISNEVSKLGNAYCPARQTSEGIGGLLLYILFITLSIGHFRLHAEKHVKHKHTHTKHVLFPIPSY